MISIRKQIAPKFQGMVGATISFGTALYPAIGGFLGEMDWRWPFWISLAALPVGLLALSVRWSARIPAWIGNSTRGIAVPSFSTPPQSGFSG